MSSVDSKKDFFEQKEEMHLVVDENCSLRIITKEDVSDDYVNWMNDYEITKYTEQRFRSHSIRDVEKFVEEKLNSQSDLLFGIFIDHRHIGNIKLGPIRWEHLNGEVSYLIGNKDYWGKGIASAVVKKVVDFGFEELGLKKINAGYYENNIGSAKVLEKCGFNIEGVRHSDVIFEGKRIKSVHVCIMYI